MRACEKNTFAAFSSKARACVRFAEENKIVKLSHAVELNGESTIRKCAVVPVRERIFSARNSCTARRVHVDPKAHRISPRTRFQSRKAARNRVENWRTDVDCFFLAPTRGGAPLRTRARTDTRAGEPRSVSGRGSGAFQTRSFRLGAFHALPTRGGRRRRRERPVRRITSEPPTP